MVTYTRGRGPRTVPTHAGVCVYISTSECPWGVNKAMYQAPGQGAAAGER